MTWDDLTACLQQRSKEICKLSGCTEEEHYCESNAYITVDGTEPALHNICPPGFWPGWGFEDVARYGLVAAIRLPWSGTGKDLEYEVEQEIAFDVDWSC